MSKRLKNYTPPDTLLEIHGADALRLYLITSGLVKGEEQRFSDNGVKDMIRKALIPWYNSFKFFNTYSSFDHWKYTPNFSTDNILDRWIISKLQSLKLKIENEMNQYHLYTVVPALFDFINDLTNSYIRLNRSRYWGDLNQDKDAAYNTLYLVLKELSQVMAPFTPFLSDHIYLELKQFEKDLPLSVHLNSYPIANKDLINSHLEKAVELMQEVILLARQKRIQEKIKVKTPLNSLTLIHQDPLILEQLKKLEEYLKIELNVKKIEYIEDESKFLKLYALPNSPVLGKRLGKDFPKFTKLIKNLSSKELISFNTQGTIILENQTFSKEEILLFKEALPNSDILVGSNISILLDTNLNDDLIEEGIAREIVSLIQKLRKDLDFLIIDRIKVYYHCSTKLDQVIKKHSDYIKGETLAKELILSDNPKEHLSTFEDQTISFSLEVLK